MTNPKKKKMMMKRKRDERNGEEGFQLEPMPSNGQTLHQGGDGEENIQDAFERKKRENEWF